jgi:hypothetical protein
MSTLKNVPIDNLLSLGGSQWPNVMKNGQIRWVSN